jgi:hypothetical protein
MSKQLNKCNIRCYWLNFHNCIVLCVMPFWLCFIVCYYKKINLTTFDDLGLNGETLVAIAGGASTGIEVWNPADGSVTILDHYFPTNFVHPQMVAVNDGTELIFYESGDNLANPQNIWKFSQVMYFWLRGSTLCTSVFVNACISWSIQKKSKSTYKLIHV